MRAAHDCNALYKPNIWTAFNSAAQSREEDAVNARLIAASPEMLGLLEEIVAGCGRPLSLNQLEYAESLVAGVLVDSEETASGPSHA